MEVQTTSLGAAADQLPPLSTLSVWVGSDDMLVITAEGGLTIEKQEEENNG